MPGIESLGLVMRDRFDDIDGVKLNLRSSAQNVTLGTVGDTPSGTQNGEFSTPGLVAVFIPFSYGFGGFTVLATPEKVRDAGIPADRALQLAITGWVKAQGGR